MNSETRANNISFDQQIDAPFFRDSHLHSNQECVQDSQIVEMAALESEVKAESDSKPSIKVRWLEKFMDARVVVDEFLQSQIVELGMTVITVNILFADDIRVLATNKDGDKYFYGISLASFFIFMLELLTLCSVRPGYFLGFFFWMDLLSTLSTAIDIPWVVDALGLGMLSGQTSLVKYDIGRASRVSSKATKVVRIIRLIRIIRVTKLYKYAQKSLARKFEMNLSIQSESVQSMSSPSMMTSVVQERTKNNSEQRVRSQSLINFDDNKIAMRSAERSISVIQSGKQVLEFTTPIKMKNSSTMFQLSNYYNKQTETDYGMSFNVMNKKGKKKSNLKPIKTSNGSSMQGLNKDFSADVIKVRKTVRLERPKTPESPNVGITQNKFKRNQSVPESFLQNPQDGQDVQDQERSQPPSANQQRTDFSPPPPIVLPDEDHEHSFVREMPSTIESNVGKMLSSLTTQRAILLMFSVVISIPIFDYSTYWTTTDSYMVGGNILVFNYQTQTIPFKYVLDKFTKYHQNQHGMVLGSISINNLLVYQDQDPLQFRNEECNFYTQQVGNDVATIIVIDVFDTHLNAILGIVRTFFVIIVLVAGVVFFNKDASDYVVIPIENMLAKVRKIAENPLEAAKMEEDNQVIESEAVKEKDEDSSMFETTILERLIIKTGTLLALGFGEAGANIIAENMQRGSAVNPLIAGKRVFGIFGFCDIRNFTDMTEVLQEHVMLFVNDIAQIVHSNVHKCHGSANKNIGDAFLLVWKIPSSICRVGDDGTPVVLHQGALNSYAEFSLFSFIKIIVDIKQSDSLAKMSLREEVICRLPGYSVKMGFGLHFGWAIEGAIGSNYKIDASYLSPNVNMAARLETATKQYGTLILISGTMHDILGQRVQRQLRQIDKVIVKGSLMPIELFTFDLDVQHLETILPNKKNPKIERYLQRKVIAKQTRRILANKMKVIQFFQDPLILSCRTDFTDQFFDIFHQGLEFYLMGHWRVSQQFFSNILTIRSDGPAQAILDFMQTHDYAAPTGWAGFRELVEK